MAGLGETLRSPWTVGHPLPYAYGSRLQPDFHESNLILQIPSLMILREDEVSTEKVCTCDLLHLFGFDLLSDMYNHFWPYFRNVLAEEVWFSGMVGF
jgi:hypothetical protein